MLNSDQNREKIIRSFPNLKNDDVFEIIGKEDPNYNCIAYAANVTDAWWWPRPIDNRPHFFAGVRYNWPYDLEDKTSLEALIELFSKKRYVVCNDSEYEEGFKKVAFYVKNGNITHAARQLTSGNRKGKWSSKLGTSFLILHKTPFTIESLAYGKAVCFMKQNMR